MNKKIHSTLVVLFSILFISFSLVIAEGSINPTKANAASLMGEYNLRAGTWMINKNLNLKLYGIKHKKRWSLTKIKYKAESYLFSKWNSLTISSNKTLFYRQSLNNNNKWHTIRIHSVSIPKYRPIEIKAEFGLHTASKIISF